MLRQHWERERAARGLNVADINDTTPTGDAVPWHCRYIVYMPGELLQIFTRQEVPAVVHRVIATEGMEPRLSAPVLLRGRSNMTFDTARYLVRGGEDTLLQECDGMTMEEIYEAIQTPFVT
jgi:isopenicillin N synthase-like dioxygenase